VDKKGGARTIPVSTPLVARYTFSSVVQGVQAMEDDLCDQDSGIPSFPQPALSRPPARAPACHLSTHLTRILMTRTKAGYFLARRPIRSSRTRRMNLTHAHNVRLIVSNGDVTAANPPSPDDWVLHRLGPYIYQAAHAQQPHQADEPAIAAIPGRWVTAT
jgi:hypothetical protein